MALQATQATEERQKVLLAHLFPEHDELHTYAILDGASVPALRERLLGDGRPQSICLYRGEMDPDIAEVAPYLCHLKRDSAFTQWLLAEGWGKHWGVFLLARTDLAGLRRHLRQFLLVRGPDGKQLYFRYYDPRVLRAYLPTCNPEELETIFGPVDHWLVEAKDPLAMLRFAVPGETLRTQTIPLSPARKPAATTQPVGGA